MTHLDADIVIIGAGFGGSLTAVLLARVGLRPVLLDRATHPRFAIGESSTPIADLVLSQLARQYDLPWLAPLAKYGTWRRAYPDLPCGLKRGFSYFQHRAGEEFRPDPLHSNELLVAASADDETADTHWYRPEFDALLYRRALAAGIPCFEQTVIESIEPRGEGWTIRAVCCGESVEFTSAFLIDASGEGGVLARRFGISTAPTTMRTQSRTIFGHFTGVKRWEDWLRRHGGRCQDHPYPCDDAALHHILEEGWMWVLPFNNGITSAGFVLDMERTVQQPALSPQQEWDQWMARYPAIAWQFADTKLVAPAGGLRRTGRLQRQAARCIGPNWAMLSTAAGFVDALQSTGNAHTLCGIERLVPLLREYWGRPELPEALLGYERTLKEELSLIDQIVHGCFVAFGRFERLAAFITTYFVGAIRSEQRRRQGIAAGDTFLQAQDADFRRTVDRLHARLLALRATNSTSAAADAAYTAEVAEALRPYNVGGVCDPARRNMYFHQGPK